MSRWEFFGRASATVLLLWLHWKGVDWLLRELQSEDLRPDRSFAAFMFWIWYGAFGVMFWACWTMGR